jgi:hypothetical protein
MKFLKLLGITLGLGMSFAWMIGLGMAFGIANALERTAIACHVSRKTAHDVPDVIMMIGVAVGTLMVVAAGVDTFRTGARPDLTDLRWLALVSAVWLFGTTALLLCLMPFWLGCSVLGAM